MDRRLRSNRDSCATDLIRAQRGFAPPVGLQRRGSTLLVNDQRRGFTLIELLVVMAIIALLATITLQVIGAVLDGARKAATESTLRKINGLVTQRLEAMQQYVLRRDLLERDPLYIAAGNDAEGIIDPTLDPSTLITRISARSATALILTKKLIKVRYLPQSWSEIVAVNRCFDSVIGTDLKFRTPAGDVITTLASIGNRASDADSSEVLYYSFTTGALVGDTQQGLDAFSANELQDTDGDGLLEFVDGWGRPLRFYRWPTRLIRPLGTATAITPANLSAAKLCYGWLPSTRDLGLDPDDAAAVLSRRFQIPANQLSTAQLDRLERPAHSTMPFDPTLYAPSVSFPRSVDLQFLTNPELFANTNATPVYHTPDTWHSPLIISAGSDGILGLYEPDDIANYGHLGTVNPAGYADLAAALAGAGNGPLNDNISNTNTRGGTR